MTPCAIARIVRTISRWSLSEAYGMAEFQTILFLNIILIRSIIEIQTK